MKNNRNNLMIIGLLSVLAIMAIGYAAFATTLTISGTATATSSWNIHYDTTVTTPTSQTTGTSGSISYNGTAATLNASLVKPGDSVVFTLTVVNEGNIAATLANPTTANNGISAGSTTTCSGTTCTSTAGHIQFTVGTFSSNTSLPAKSGSTNGTRTITVTATFLDEETISSMTSAETANMTVYLNATQA